MLKLVLAEIPHFRLTPIEIEEARTSYTIDTLQRLIRPDVQYRLLLTKESADTFSQWKHPEEIQRLAPLLIGNRLFPISSTEVRKRLKKKRYCGHLVPAKALDYIRHHQLYCAADHEKDIA
jgi:nicotinic acid mononucleotide adenylyltransferase